MRHELSVVALAIATATAPACGPTTQDPPPSSSTTSETDPGPTTRSTTDATPPTTSPGSTGPTGSTNGDSTTASADTTGTSSTTGPPACVPQCRDPFDCNNGIDDDGDGLADLDDPDCLAPCHHDEQSTHHGHPGGGADCIADCFWDDNLGAGDDDCYLDTRCDPLGPEAHLGCEPHPDPPPAQCSPREVGTSCQPACLPLTPPGCDCFGCCTVPTPGGAQDLWMADPLCSLDDPAACSACTKNESCAQPCDDPCAWCFGEPALPPGCDQAACGDAQPCDDQCECGDGEACLQGCCRPLTAVP